MINFEKKTLLIICFIIFVYFFYDPSPTVIEYVGTIVDDLGDK